MKRTGEPIRRVRWRRWILVGVGGVVVAISSSGLWFPWALRLAAASRGWEVTSHERLGWHTLRLRGVEGRWDEAQVQIAVLDVAQPLVWLAHLTGWRDASERPCLEATDGSVSLAERPADLTQPRSLPSPAQVERLGATVLSGLEWLPGPVRVTRGVVKRGTQAIRIREASLTGDRLNVLAESAEWIARAEWGWDNPAGPRLVARLDPLGLELTLTTRREAADWRVEGTLTSQGRTLQMTATVDPHRWIPTTAAARARELVVPLDPFVPGNLQADVDLEWTGEEGRVATRVMGAVQPPGLAADVPVEGTVSARWTLDRIIVEEAFIASDPLDVRLSSPLTAGIDSVTRMLRAMRRSPAAQANQDAEAGRAGGTGVGVGEPVAADTLASQVVKVEVRARLDPWTQGRVTGDLHARASVSGSITNLQHAVNLRATIVPRPGWRPWDVEASLEGVGSEVTHADVCATDGDTEVRLRGQGEYDRVGARADIRLLQLEVERGVYPILTLADPAFLSVSWLRSRDSGTTGPIIRLEPFELQGDPGRLQVSADVQWPGRARFELEADGWDQTLWKGWAESSIPWSNAVLRQLTVAGHWDHGPVEGTLAFAWDTDHGPGGRVAWHGRGELRPEGLHIEAGSLAPDGPEGLRMRAELPLRILPGDAQRPVQLDVHAPWNGQLHIPPSSWLWEWWATFTGVRTSDAKLDVALSGSPSAPRLTATGSAGATTLEGTDQRWQGLGLDSLSLRVDATEHAVECDPLQVRIAGTDVLVKGRFPLPGTPWGEFREAWRSLSWREGEATLTVADGDLAPLLRRWPDAVAPQGRVRAEVTLQGGDVGGWVEATGLALKAREPMGALRDVALRLALKRNRISIERGEGTLGGQPIQVTGWVEAPGLDSIREATADLQLVGTNLTLARTAGVVLRADVDLRLARPDAGAVPALAGAVVLRDSLVMIDARELVAVDLERPERRPPYFHVAQAPFSDWGLHVRVRGERFARVLSPAFRGTLSLDSELLGTLGRPRLLGEGVVDSGQILFPFGQLQIEHARVRFSEATPYQPALDGRAEGMNFGYAVVLDLGGTLDEPEVGFSSVPPMSTREVLQMLTAGHLPNREYSYSSTAKVQNLGTYLASDFVTLLTGDPTQEARLSINSGQRISTAGRLTYGVEYRLSDRWYLVGEYDRWSQFNAGVRWRVLQR